MSSRDVVTSVGLLRSPSSQAVLVCGLGRLGQQCVKSLAGYRVPVRAIDLQPPTGLRADLADITIGDFRDPETLRRAGIEHCRSIVLVAGDVAANVEGAFAARRVNPNIRLVVRAEQQTWDSLLSDRLGNVVVYEPNRLSAPAFAFAVLDAHVLAHFYVDEQLFQVTEHQVQEGERWVGTPIESAQVPGRQILLHVPVGKTQEEAEFFGWHPEEKIGVGDRLFILTRSRPADAHVTRPRSSWLETARVLWRDLKRQRREGFSRPAVVSLVGLGVLLTLLLLAVVFFSATAPHLQVADSLRLALMLMTGGHLADVMANFDHLPRGVQWAELILTITGTLLTAIVYALLTDRLLTARFNLLTRRPRAPVLGHVIIAGLGATGERIAGLLHQLQRPAVAIASDGPGPHAPAHLPIIRGSGTVASTLEEAHLATAHGLVASTADELQNVQIALLAASLNPRCRLAVRIFDPRLSENVSSVLPDARVLCISTLAATAYAAAALGENVISLFPVLGRPVLVVEYVVGEGDTLDKRALWEIAEGYAVVPVLFQPANGKSRAPSLDDAVVKLGAGDRLVVLASSASLEAIERGELRPREYELQLERLRPYAEPLQIVGILTQRFGYSLEQARDVLAHLPQPAPQRMYGLYARRTYRMLQANGVLASLRRVAMHGPRGVVENLSRRPPREPALDLTRSLGQAAQPRERSAVVAAATAQPRIDPHN
ncbi:MAG: NAD-binding protein [Polyangiales bacterium]